MRNGTAARRRALAGAALLLGLLAPGAGTAAAQTEVPPGVVPAPDELRPREDTYETARGIGMGIGARAGAVGTSALAYNAANLPLAQLYHIESIFGYLVGEQAFVAGGAIADSITSRLAAGMAFRGVFGGGDRDFSGWDGRLSLGVPLAQAIALGVSARYVRLHADRETADGQPIGEEARGFTMDAALRVTPVEGFHIAALVYNMIDLDSSLAPLRVGGGVSYQYRTMFQIGLDTLVDLSTFEIAEVLVAGGAEYLAGEIVPIRLGFQHDTGRRLSSLTAGLGYTQQKAGVDLSLRQDFGRDKATLLLLGIRYHVH